MARWRRRPDDRAACAALGGFGGGLARRFRGRRPLLLVLTGTDLYRDIADDAAAQHSLAVAQQLVVLHEAGVQDLPEHWRSKAAVCLQSAPARWPLAKTRRHLRALMVGHLREEKSPQTYFEAARRLAHRHDIRLDHIGGALDSALATQARALMREQPATAGWVLCRTPPRDGASRRRMCWSTPAGWKAAPMS